VVAVVEASAKGTIEEAASMMTVRVDEGIVDAGEARVGMSEGGVVRPATGLTR
jgi:hypothetical protein